MYIIYTYCLDVKIDINPYLSLEKNCFILQYVSHIPYYFTSFLYLSLQKIQNIAI